MDFNLVEFNNGMKEIAKCSFSLDSVNDRVMCTEWIRKLLEKSDDETSMNAIKNDYVQHLKIMVRESVLHGPYTHVPPELYLLPLPEYLGNLMRESIPELPQSGPLSPVISHSSSDGRACLSAQTIPGGGIFFYMAVSPDGL